jgi:putative endopeptidase
MKKTSWGFDVRDMDPEARPQDDLYRHANGGWLDRNTIPKTESRWGSFMALRYDTEKKLKGIVEELADARPASLTPGGRQIRALYRSAMDLKRRNALGAKPLAPLRKKVASLATRQQLLDLLAEFHRLGIDGIWGAGVGQDSKNTSRYLLHFYQSGLGMPDRDYYLKDDAESVRVRAAYVPHVARMLALAGYKPSEAKRRAATVMHIETKLAEVSMDKVDRRDAEKTYTKMTVKQLSALAPGIDWGRYLKKSGVAAAPALIVMMPGFFQGISRLLEDVPIEDWKAYLEWQVVGGLASALSERFERENFAFYGAVLRGTKHMKPLWRRALSVVEGSLGELLGREYVKRYFGAEARRKMDVLVDDLLAAYAARLAAIEWMSPPTRKKALKKLRALNRKIGHPKKWRSYGGLVMREGDYVGNLLRSSEYEHRRQLKKLKGPIDRGEWFMTPQTVNAYFDPNMNDIAFPAAILQPPFFDPSADDAVNYGSIGSVIGHEITHGFDDQGSKYDEKGNLKDWWTAEDRKRFEEKAGILVSQYDQYEVADGVKVNGKLTLGENIADLGGMAIAFDAYQRQLERTGRRDIEGLSPERRFFLAFAVFEREHSRPEFQKLAALNDPHSPGRFRINGPASNFEAFYDAYGVEEGDALWRPEEARARIW